MKKSMRAISVEANEQGFILLSQEVEGTDEVPVIWLSPDQVPLVSEWLLEAAGEREEPQAEGIADIPVDFFSPERGTEPHDLNVFNNHRGMIVLKLTDEYFIEMSPAMAKRLRENLSRAIRSSLTGLLGPDAGA